MLHIEVNNDSKIPENYYDSPWLPNLQEREEWPSLPLTPSEAHYIFVNRIADGFPTSSIDKLALNEIINGEDTQDFLIIRKLLEDKK